MTQQLDDETRSKIALNRFKMGNLITFGGVNTGRYKGNLKEIFGQVDSDQSVFRVGGNVNGAPFSNSSLWFVDAGKALTYLNPVSSW
ncbi:hypothetical protein LXG23DRAFT_52615 [Yarrowia lipolytica]|nr:hypothetical protein LXG23DRAFT_52615 [Yarrowia lipolytica]